MIKSLKSSKSIWKKATTVVNRKKNKRRYETYFLLFEIVEERNRKAVYTVSLEVQRTKREEDIDGLGQSILNYHLLQRNVEETKIK